MNQCEVCGREEGTVEIQIMPCCGATICWDFCLRDEPAECPVCTWAIKIVTEPVSKVELV